MAFTPTYHKRNLENIAQLADNTKVATLKWYNYCIANEIDVLIYETIRTEATQRQYVANGVSQTMKSYHLVCQALDFVPIVNGKSKWDGYSSDKVKKAYVYARKLDFELGADWKNFVDKPHMQFNYKGYGTDTFKNKGKLVEVKPVSKKKYYVVKSGDTVSEIATKYKTTIAKIKTLNKLDKDYTIHIGQKLRVK